MLLLWFICDLRNWLFSNGYVLRISRKLMCILYRGCASKFSGVSFWINIAKIMRRIFFIMCRKCSCYFFFSYIRSYPFLIVFIANRMRIVFWIPIEICRPRFPALICFMNSVDSVKSGRQAGRQENQKAGPLLRVWELHKECPPPRVLFLTLLFF